MNLLLELCESNFCMTVQMVYVGKASDIASIYEYCLQIIDKKWTKLQMAYLLIKHMLSKIFIDIRAICG